MSEANPIRPIRIDLKGVMTIFGWRSRSTVFDRIKTGFLPKPLLEGCKNYWSFDEIETLAKTTLKPSEKSEV